MVDVSIIVPVYKVERYLDRCVNSLVNQTLKNIEIILVDDGSPDLCPNMCDVWAQKDGRIKVIHKKNQGLGYARNTGIGAAIGEFIGFADSDDYVASDMFEKLFLAAKKENADIAMCGFCCIGGIMTEKKNAREEINCFDKYTVFKGNEINKLMLDISGSKPHEKQDSKYGFSSVKNIYKTETLKNNNIRFLSEREVASEDVFFLLDFLLKAECAVGIQGAYYYYCRNGESLSKSYRSDRFEKSVLIIDGINKRLKVRMPESEYKLYTERLFQAYARAACMQEIQFQKINGITNKELDRRLKAICMSTRLKDTLKKYPWYRLPFTQAVFAFTMRFSLVKIQKILVCLKSKCGG